MKHKHLLIPAILASTLLTGCVGTGPNTQQGAVAGGMLGALAGAIIGNNSGNHDAGAGALIGAAAGAIAGGTLGNAEDNADGTVYGAQGRTSRRYRTVMVEQSPPPAPPNPQTSDMVSAAPNSDAVWIPGYWDFNGTGYTWAQGHWETPPTNSQSYVAAHWENRSNGYVFVRGYWM